MLLDGLRALAAATATGTPHAMVPALLDESRRDAVEDLAADAQGRGERTQRVAFGVHRLADALAGRRGPDDRGLARRDRTGRADRTVVARLGTTGRRRDRAERRRECAGGPAVATPQQVTLPRCPSPAPHPRRTTRPRPTRTRPRLRLSTRQALQAGVAVALSIVVGELVSPTRWYWATVAAFVVFAGTNSRGDVLSRGWRTHPGHRRAAWPPAWHSRSCSAGGRS